MGHVKLTPGLRGPGGKWDSSAPEQSVWPECAILPPEAGFSEPPCNVLNSVDLDLTGHTCILNGRFSLCLRQGWTEQSGLHSGGALPSASGRKHPLGAHPSVQPKRGGQVKLPSLPHGRGVSCPNPTDLVFLSLAPTRAGTRAKCRGKGFHFTFEKSGFSQVLIQVPAGSWGGQTAGWPQVTEVTASPDVLGKLCVMKLLRRKLPQSPYTLFKAADSPF